MTPALWAAIGDGLRLVAKLAEAGAWESLRDVVSAMSGAHVGKISPEHVADLIAHASRDLEVALAQNDARANAALAERFGK